MEYISALFHWCDIGVRFKWKMCKYSDQQHNRRATAWLMVFKSSQSLNVFHCLVKEFISEISFEQFWKDTFGHCASNVPYKKDCKFTKNSLFSLLIEKRCFFSGESDFLAAFNEGFFNCRATT